MLPDTVRRLVVRVARALVRAGLRAEAAASDWRGPSRRPRILATACYRFPIYSQSFVYQEVCALAERRFAVRFSYSMLGQRSHLAPRFSRLWRVRRRLLFEATARPDDFRYYQKRMPAKVESLIHTLCEESGQSRDALVNHEHFLQAFSFTRMAAAWRPDYLHSYFFYERTLFTLVASWLLGIPRGVSCYADHMLDDYPLKLVALNVRSCDVVVATSQRVASELQAIAGPAGLPNLVVKHNGIDTSEFDASPRLPALDGAPACLVSVSRIEPKKGLRYLVDALGVLRREGVDVDLHLLGAPDEHQEASVACAKDLDAQVAAERLAGCVHFEGQQDASSVRRFLARAHVFVAPFVELDNGDKDGIPTAVLEAMASRCAIVATDAGSITEVIDHGRNGLIVPQRDPIRLAEAIRTLLSDAALRERLARNAAEDAARRFDVAHSEGVFHERIRQAVARRAT